MSDADTPARPDDPFQSGSRMQKEADATSDGLWRKVFCAFFFLVPVSSVLASQSIVPLFLVATALLALSTWRSTGKNRWPLPDLGLTAALGGLVAFCALASLWGFDTPRSLLLTGRIAVLFGAGLFLHTVLRHLDEPSRVQAGNWLLAGMGLALAVLYLEPAFDFPLLGVLHEPGTGAKLGNNILSRGATAVAILCWPACALLWRRAGAIVAICLPIAVLTSLAFLSSQAAGLGLLAGAAMIVIAGTHRQVGRIVLVIATLSAMIMSPLAGQQFYEARLQDADWLPNSAAHRVEIWHFTAQRIAEKPALGWGFDAARDMALLATKEEASGRSPIALHPHNAPLQILLELGIVGAFIALAVLWALIQRLETLPKRERILGQAAYIASLAISTTAYGLWQNQWLALLMAAALAVSLTARAPVRDQAGQ